MAHKDQSSQCYPRTFLQPDEWAQLTDQGVLAKEAAHYFHRVLRLKAGARAQLFSSDGRSVEVILGEAKKKHEVEIVREINAPESSLRELTLIQGAPKASKCDHIVRRATEAGVSRICFFRAERSQEKLDKVERNHARMMSVAVDAARQSLRATLPDIIYVPTPLNIEHADINLCAHLIEGEPPARVKDLLSPDNSLQSIALWVGPEGGWSDGEIDQIQKIGGHCISLGPFVFRSEFAGPVGVAIIRAAELGL